MIKSLLTDKHFGVNNAKLVDLKVYTAAWVQHLSHTSHPRSVNSLTICMTTQIHGSPCTCPSHTATLCSPALTIFLDMQSSVYKPPSERQHSHTHARKYPSTSAFPHATEMNH